MKINEIRILKEMTAPEAVRVFVKAGFDPRGKSPAEIKQAYRTLIFKNHPDRGGNETLAKQINQAYTILKQGVIATAPSPGSGRSGFTRDRRAWDAWWGAADKRREEANAKRDDPNTGWAQAGWAGGLPNSSHIYRENYTDMNFIKKTMWEKAGKSTDEEWTIDGYDGAFFRNTLTVYGNKSIFKDMAEAMVMWQTKGGNPYQCKAVFVHRRHEKTMYLIWLDGIDLSKNPIQFEHDSFNYYAGNDQAFLRSLPERLDKIKASHMMRNVGRGKNTDKTA